MIRFITGNPGAGKGLYGVKVIVEELARGTRPVYTNLPLDVGRLNEYLQEQYPDVDASVVQRVRVLADDEVSAFYRLRPDGRVETDGDKLKFSDCRQGVFYLIDEAQNFFNSRAWAKTGPFALFYLSQHRKLGDDVWLCTQAPSNVDKQFRSVAQDYIHLRNLGNEKRGWFRMPRCFIWSQSLEPRGPNVRATASGTFTLDVKGLGSCYSTAQGVGVPGIGEADKGRTQRGLHWAILPVGFAAMIFGFWWVTNHGASKFLPSLFGGTVQKAVGSSPKTPVPSAAPVEPVKIQERPATSPVLPQDSPKRSVPVAAPAVQAASLRDPDAPDLVGYTSHGPTVRVYLTDGTDLEIVRSQFLPVSGGCAIRERAGWVEYRFPRRRQAADQAGLQEKVP